MPHKEKELTFDQALQELEEIVQKLETGGLPLEESMDAFESAVKLGKFCDEKLTGAEQKIQQLVRLPDGSVKKEPLHDLLPPA